MQKKSLSRVLAQLDKPWDRLDLGILDSTHRVTVVWHKGTYSPHRHDRDEFYLVLEGEIRIKTRTRSIRLRKGESFLMKKGRPHQSYSGKGAYVLQIRARETDTEEVRNFAGISV